MKTPKLLKLSKEALSNEKSKIYRKKSCLKELQVKLKKRHKKLKEKTFVGLYTIKGSFEFKIRVSILSGFSHVYFFI